MDFKIFECWGTQLPRRCFLSALPTPRARARLAVGERQQRGRPAAYRKKEPARLVNWEPA